MARQQRNSTATQMVVAMGVLMVPIAIIVAFFTYNPPPTIQQVDYLPVARVAAQESPYPVLVPDNLPEGWVATRARWTLEGRPGLNGDPAAGNTWQLGMLSPEQTYVAVDQRDSSQELFVQQVTRDGEPARGIDGRGSGVAAPRFRGWPDPFARAPGRGGDDRER
jgi:hypothetical protein